MSLDCIEFPNKFSMGFIQDLQLNRSSEVIGALKKSHQKFVREFLDWVKNHGEWATNHSQLLKDVYFFIKYNSWDTDILHKIDQINQKILGIKDDKAAANDRYNTVKGKEFVSRGNKEELEAFILKLSESQKFHFYSPQENNETVFHVCKDLDKIQILEKHCPGRLRGLMFAKDTSGMMPFHSMLKKDPIHIDEILDFYLERCPQEKLVEIFSSIQIKYIDRMETLHPLAWAWKCGSQAIKIALEICSQSTIDEQLAPMFVTEVRREDLVGAKSILELLSPEGRKKAFQKDAEGDTILHHVAKGPEGRGPDIAKFVFANCPQELVRDLFAQNGRGFTPFEIEKEVLRLYPYTDTFRKILLENCPEDLKPATTVVEVKPGKIELPANDPKPAALAEGEKKHKHHHRKKENV